MTNQLAQTDSDIPPTKGAAVIVSTVFVSVCLHLLDTGVAVKPVVKSFVTRLILDITLTTPEITAFFVQSDEHRQALRDWLKQAARKEGLSGAAQQLDLALGNPTVIASLIREQVSEFAYLTWGEG